jgi:hypothetical protein
MPFLGVINSRSSVKAKIPKSIFSPKAI